MSTKCSILYRRTKKNIWYHFYWDYKDDDYHLEYKNQSSYNHFLRRIGRLLEQCPLSDAGIYFIGMKNGVKDKVVKNKGCGLLTSRK